jgi:hypothetical protein
VKPRLQDRCFVGAVLGRGSWWGGWEETCHFLLALLGCWEGACVQALAGSFPGRTFLWLVAL